jgi:TRAP-type mannitol/chloroaromatic compound transport system permease small subunit
MREAATLIEYIDRFTDGMGRVIAWLMLVMVLATLLVVALRYALDQGAIVLQETVMYLHGLAFMLGIPYALKENAHVRVDIIYARLNLRKRAAVDLAGHLLFLIPLSVFILVYSWSYVGSAWRIMEGSAEVGGVPAVFLLKTLIPLMASLLLLQGIAEILRNLTVLKGPSG